MATVTAAVGAVGGVTNIVSGLVKQKKAQAAISNFSWNELTNPFEDISVSTEGTDRAIDEVNRSEAAALDTLSKSGSRGVIGGTQRVQQQSTNAKEKIAANLDQRRAQLDQKIAQAEAQNQVEKSRRKDAELQGYGAMLNQANQERSQGLNQFTNAFAMLGQTEWGASLDKKIGDKIIGK